MRVTTAWETFFATALRGPYVGQPVECHGVACRIIKIHPAFTIDIQEIGGRERCWRVTGLSWGVAS